MRILIAPDSFKESLTAAKAAEAIARGIRRTLPDAEPDRCPMADGGEGTVEALVEATGGEMRRTRVTGPLGDPVDAAWGLLGPAGSDANHTDAATEQEAGGGEAPRTAVIEMAQAAGLMLVPKDRRDPARTTTFGVGELIRAALDAGAERIIVGIGGSATNDGGTGMAEALGARFPGGSTPMTGGDLSNLKSVDLTDLDPRLAETEIVVACDVTNPLTGPGGAATVYGPQKGATPERVRQLDAGLNRLASLLPDIDPDAPGMGAAGGLGFGLVAFYGAALRPGIGLVLDAVRFDQRVRDAALVLTGEGRLDGQSIQGKACIGVAQAAARHHVPTVALVGSLGPEAERTLSHGLTAYHSLTADLNVSTDDAIMRSAELLEELATKVISQYVTIDG